MYVTLANGRLRRWPVYLRNAPVGHIVCVCLGECPSPAIDRRRLRLLRLHLAPGQRQIAEGVGAVARPVVPRPIVERLGLLVVVGAVGTQRLEPVVALVCIEPGDAIVTRAALMPSIDVLLRQDAGMRLVRSCSVSERSAGAELARLPSCGR